LRQFRKKITMTQFYTDPSRETNPTALPNAEVFYMEENEAVSCDDEGMLAGWYYWYCFPGCLPDSGIFGPFATSDLAIKDAQDNE
jgi:hypothetical protein